MDNNPNIPIGFITVEDAIKIINNYDGSVSETVPQPDITEMIRRHRWIEPPRNMNIRFFTVRTDKYGRTTKHTEESKWVQINDEFQAQSLKHALAVKFRELAGQEFDMSTSLRTITTSVDPDDKHSGRPRKNANPVASVGDSINSSMQVVNGEQA